MWRNFFTIYYCDMFRKISLLFALLLSVVVWAGPISKEQAIKEAQAFLNSRRNMPHTAKMRQAYRAPKLMSASEQSYFYVFNVGDNNGFVIVSGDDRTEQILGYADVGSFDESKMNPNMKSFLDSYIEEFKQLDKLNIPSVKMRASQKAVIKAREAISPLVARRWNQDEPYNNLCPVINDDPKTTADETKDTKNGRFVTGCVATAMAQVMGYHRWPKTTTAVIPAYTTDELHYNIPEMPVTTFDWNNMLDVYGSSYTQAQGDAVAKLMQYCGSSVDMSYNYSSTGGSGAIGGFVPHALKTYFDYSATTRVIFREAYTADTWADVLYRELEAKRPVVFCGSSPSGGHCFVMDGYSQGEYFHINWGWGGFQDGYYRLSVLEPGQQGIGGFTGGYSRGQQAIVGIQPNHGEAAAPTVIAEGIAPAMQRVTRTSKDVNFKGTDFGDPNFYGVSFVFKAINTEKTAQTYYVGVGLYNDKGELVTVLSDGGNSLTFSQFGAGRDIYIPSIVDFGAGIPLGTYKVLPIYKTVAAPTWLLCEGSTRNYVEAKITDTEYIVTKAEDGSNKSLQATSTVEGNLLKYDPQIINFDVTNNGSDFYDDVYLMIDGKADKSKVVSLSVAPGKTSRVSFGYTPYESRAYTYSLATIATRKNPDTGKDEGYFKDIPGSAGTFTISDRVYKHGKIASCQITVDDIDDSKNVFGSIIKGKVTFNNTGTLDFEDKVRIVFADGSTGKGLDYVETTISVPAGQSGDVPFTFSGLEPNKQYVIAGFFYDYQFNQLNPALLFTAKEGVLAVNADGTFKNYDPSKAMNLTHAAAVDFQSSAVTGTITPSANPNALYYFNASATVPTALNGKNVIKGNVADKIALVDGSEADFFPIYNFTASDITYTRNFAKGNDGTTYNWQTIVLPFDVTDITVNDTSYDWFRAKEEKGKSIWLMNVYGEDESDNKMYYEYSQEFKANRPYIIAVAGNRWGAKYDLTAKNIVFHGTNAEIAYNTQAVVSTNKYNFYGSYRTKALESAYQLNAAGTKFVGMPSLTVAPFHAYFKSDGEVITETSGAKELKVCILGDDPTGIHAVHDENDASSHTIYNVSGVVVGHGKADFDHLPRGVYIMNGKKIIK